MTLRSLAAELAGLVPAAQGTACIFFVPDQPPLEPTHPGRAEVKELKVQFIGDEFVARVKFEQLAAQSEQPVLLEHLSSYWSGPEGESPCSLGTYSGLQEMSEIPELLSPEGVVRSQSRSEPHSMRTSSCISCMKPRRPASHCPAPVDVEGHQAAFGHAASHPPGSGVLDSGLSSEVPSCPLVL